MILVQSPQIGFSFTSSRTSSSESAFESAPDSRPSSQLHPTALAGQRSLIWIGNSPLSISPSASGKYRAGFRAACQTCS